MAPAKQEIANGIPFVGPSGKIFNEALTSAKVGRTQVYVTNLVEFFVDDNDLYAIPKEILEAERQRVFQELDEVKPNCLLVMGAQTLVLLMEGYVGPFKSRTQKWASSKWSITKWRGSIFEIACPSGRKQKCVAAMHPASFIRGQWKWLPIFKYIDVPRAVTQSLSPAMSLTPRQAIVGPSFKTAREYLLEANEQEEVSIDYEGRSHITCLGVGWSATEALCVPLSRVGSSRYWTLEEEAALWKLWCALLQNPKVKKIAQNASYEWIKSWIYGIYPTPLGMDTMHMHHCLYPDFGGVFDEWSKRKRDIDNPGHGLAFIVSQYTDQPFYKDEGRHWRPEFGEEVFWRYNALDVMVTYECAMKMRTELQTTDLWQTYVEQYLEQFEHTLYMEWQGVLIDIARRAAARDDTLASIDTLRKELRTMIGLEVITKAPKGAKPRPGVLNLASPQQLQHFLYKVKRYAPRLNRQTGKPTGDKDTLQMLATKHADPTLHKFIKMKQLQDLINDVLEQPLDEQNHIHCHYKIGGTNGTRLSSSESILGSGANLQNLPRQGIARSLFLPG